MEKYLIEHCSPTLAGLKTANMFSLDIKSDDDFRVQINRLNLLMQPKGVKLAVLHIKDGRALVYVYRPEMLARDFRKNGTVDFMKQYGYFSNDNINTNKAIKLLCKQFSLSDSFPHEIGVFLGYPLEDVVGFIENGGKNCKCCGCWKVYCNECEAMKQFERFKKCSRIYKELWHSGRSIMKLTVAA